MLFDAFEYGSESISHVAEIDGVYRIEVVRVDLASRGGFEIVLDAVRLPVPDDDARIKAEQLSTQMKRSQNSTKPGEAGQGLQSGRGGLATLAAA